MNSPNQASSETVMQALINELYLAFQFFNRHLFNDMLPDVSISIGIKRGVRGVFYAARFTSKNLDGDLSSIDEILLNPISFDQDELFVLSTLVHEMVHLYELHYGNPGKNRYHNKSWAKNMKAVGLYPSHTGEPGGQETGFKMTHYIIEEGIFYSIANQFITETGFSIEFAVVEMPNLSSSPRKVRYICSCDKPRPIWASHADMDISCNACETNFIGGTV